MVMVQIETKEALQNTGEILSVDGVNASFIGPMDLSASMDFLGRPDHPKAMKAISEVLAAGKKAHMAGEMLHSVQKLLSNISPKAFSSSH